MEIDNPPRRSRVSGNRFDPDPLAPLVHAIRSGRLVALLEGDGLSTHAIRELMKPETVMKLRNILNERVFLERVGQGHALENDAVAVRCDTGKLLLFPGREKPEP